MPFKPPTYKTDCPQCGKELQPVALGPDTAPWLCGPTGCSLGFFACELTATARKSWGHHGFIHGPHSEQLHADRLAEFAQSVSRGTSLREDQIGIASTELLQSLTLNPNVSAAFLALVQTQLTNSGGA